MPLFRNSVYSVILLLVSISSQGMIQDTLSVKDSLSGRKCITVAAMGDIMLGTSFPTTRYLPPGNDAWPLIEELAPEIDSADISFGNLEGPFSNGAALEKKCRDTLNCYAFRVPESYAPTLKKAGFDILSLANNHIGDFGSAARNSTLRILDSLGIGYAGPVENPYYIFNRAGLTIGFCAFSPNKGTLDINNYDEAKRIVTFLNDTCDIVIVSFHGGAEGADYQHVTGEREYFYGENRGNVYEFARLVIDNGADLVFGHGPHVTRAIDVYKDRFIAYSLGNFITYRRFNISGPNGFSPMVVVKTDSTGKFEEASIIPLYQDINGHVRIDARKRAIEKIRELTSIDFPDNNLIIDEDGKVKYKNISNGN